MSKATRQSLALLATVSGAMKVTESLKNEENELHFRFMSKYIEEARKRSDNAVYKWNCTGDENKNTKIIIEHITWWEKELEKQNWQITPLVLTNMSLQCLYDLHTKIKDKYKLSLIEPIIKPLKKLSDYIDPHGDKFETYQYVDNLLSILYKKIEFTL